MLAIIGPGQLRPAMGVAAVGSVLLLLSAILMITTVFPNIDIIALAAYLAVILAVSAVAATAILRRTAHRRTKAPLPEIVSRSIARADRTTWRMPPLTLLQPVTWSAGTRVGMFALRGYLIVAVVLLVFKAIQLGRL